MTSAGKKPLLAEGARTSMVDRSNEYREDGSQHPGGDPVASPAPVYDAAVGQAGTPTVRR